MLLGRWIWERFANGLRPCNTSRRSVARYSSLLMSEGKRRQDTACETHKDLRTVAVRVHCESQKLGDILAQCVQISNLHAARASSINSCSVVAECIFLYLLRPSGASRCTGQLQREYKPQMVAWHVNITAVLEQWAYCSKRWR